VTASSSRRPLLITGCARSGTTSIATILGKGTSVDCRIEPAPNLNRETRDVTDGVYSGDIDRLLESTVLARVAEERGPGRVYVEKNVTYGPFIERLAQMSEVAFLFVHRDGRDVASSLVNWHERLFGSVYRECMDPGELSEEACRRVGSLPVEDDASDYSRPRPHPDDIWFDRWERFSRLEMCAWYWSRINDLMLNALERVDAARWRSLDYSRIEVQDIQEVATWMGIRGLDGAAVGEMLARRINSLQDRTGESGRFPTWPEWDDDARTRFDAVAAPVMQRLGHYPRAGYVRFRPHSFGTWWQSNDKDLDWYRWMFDGRRAAHADLERFVAGLDRTEGGVETILDVGCGRAVGYAERFVARRYVGLDLSRKEIDWCRVHRANPRHRYLCGDLLEMEIDEEFDLVFSQGTIDNVYDIDSYLRRMVELSRRWIYVTAYKGWFPELPEHRYVWDPETTCYYNDVSAPQVRAVLAEIGCTGISVTALETGVDSLPFETRITARVPGVANGVPSR